jgi:hypothetical protein
MGARTARAIFLIHGSEVDTPEDRETKAYRMVAHALLNRAVLDATLKINPQAKNVEESRAIKSKALQFLGTPSPDLAFWCQLAQVQMSRVVRRFTGSAASGL